MLVYMHFELLRQHRHVPEKARLSLPARFTVEENVANFLANQTSIITQTKKYQVSEFSLGTCTVPPPFLFKSLPHSSPLYSGDSICHFPTNMWELLLLSTLNEGQGSAITIGLLKMTGYAQTLYLDN